MLDELLRMVTSGSHYLFFGWKEEIQIENSLNILLLILFCGVVKVWTNLGIDPEELLITSADGDEESRSRWCE